LFNPQISQATTSSSYISFTAEVWADNWFALYINGKKVGEDSVSIKTERSFNSEKITFKAKYPLAIGIIAKDYVENASGLEYIGKPNQQIGDGGIALQIFETVSKKIIAKTDSSWRSLVIDKAPLNQECVSSNNPLSDCQSRTIAIPKKWTEPSFNDSKWKKANIFSESEIGVKEGYFNIQWAAGTQLIWSEDLRIDNTILFRKVISSAKSASSSISKQTSATSSLALSSSDFNDGGLLPMRYTCDGAGISPPLQWSGVPENVESFAIVMDSIPGPPRPGEVEAATHFYLLLYNIPKEIRAIEAGNKSVGILGGNFLGRELGYTPPCSQGPGLKSYTLTIYALSGMLELSPDQATLSTLTNAIKNKIIASSKISVNYSRS
jgi:phosphatidylethanolamine-binding protein (PEBP) family uncharacterized protein